MIKSVGIDLAGSGEHKVRCLDEEAQLCDGFGFESTPEGLAKLVVPGKADSSKLFQVLQSGKMPPAGKLGSAKLATIRQWIDEGAKDN